MTPLQKRALAHCIMAWRRDEHYVASGHGERVTLASLYRKGLLTRRARRGCEGDADAAYEYQPAEVTIASWLEAEVSLRERRAAR